MKAMKTFAVAALIASVAVPALAEQRTLVFNTDASDPAPKAAFEQLVADFEAAYPEIDVVVNTFDHEGYKTAIRNFLTADSPDLANWYAGNRMRPFVEVGQFIDVSDVWAENGLYESLGSALSSMTIDGKQWGVPYTYYQWGIYYNKDAYAKAGVDAASIKTWDDFISACEKFQAAGIDCLTTGSKALWPIAGIFDYLDLRTNGYDFHMQLTSGDIAWTDDRVKAVFAEWAKVLPYTTANHAAIDWQDAVSNIVQGSAANYVIGNFAVAAFKDGGLTNDNLGFMQFPEITPGLARAEEAPTDTIHIPAGAKNVEDAKLFLAFLASSEVQTKMNGTLGQLPINSGSSVGDDPYLAAGFEMLSTADGGIAQFFDRDAPAEMAKAGMEGFQEFMVKPERLDDILERLEKVRVRVYQ
ncbi:MULTISPECIES: ABC transporter substrate-binding protein [Rhodobacterales]|uniref:ABC transporter substrate-binding protein n=1 Tax=Rhodobacterales TaxID=204455 RepID=UPI000AC553B3|nr:MULTISPECIES: ABC transporter substrate-binding protein [Marivivens]MCL7407257.1 ABC transporter substrate-binding protein [Marivivens geojensis]MCL7407453.1 ABC transporter substrate-binding protein [Marivivens donghaensis]MDN3704568.1 ABC transporter substrate-binding protein [Marivivens donghaensis]